MVAWSALRRLFTLFLKDQTGHELQASSLSDGTLRYLALSVLELDPERSGVLCLEEPENGIHPEKLAAMIRLLEDIAVDSSLVVDDSNPLQQVLINTHSPIVVSLMAVGSVYFAQRGRAGLAYRPVINGGSSERPGPSTAVLGDVLSYLNPLKGHQTVIPQRTA